MEMTSDLDGPAPQAERTHAVPPGDMATPGSVGPSITYLLRGMRIRISISQRR
jgi:hypothetical protein